MKRYEGYADCADNQSPTGHGAQDCTRSSRPWSPHDHMVSMAMERMLLYAPHSNKHPYITCTTGTRHRSVDSPAVVPQQSIAYRMKLKSWYCGSARIAGLLYVDETFSEGGLSKRKEEKTKKSRVFKRDRDAGGPTHTAVILKTKETKESRDSHVAIKSKGVIS